MSPQPDSPQHNPQSQLVQKLLDTWPIKHWQNTSVIVAVSGGADSVALLRAMQATAVRPDLLHVAHFNHAWRGAESDEDARFVVELSRTLNLSYTVGKNPEIAHSSRSEQIARKARYQFLHEVAQARSAQYIATAHTASDRVETMLHNLCRGTGLAGMCTPAVSRWFDQHTTLVRPLVHCFRNEIIEYLVEKCQPYRHDTSNANQAYRRNFLRHSALPLLRQAYGDSLDHRLLSFSQLAEQMLDIQQGLAQMYWGTAQKLELEKVKEGWLPRNSPAEIRLPAAALLPAQWPIVLLALQKAWHSLGWKQQALTRHHWQRLEQRWRALEEPKKLRPRNPRSLCQLPDNVHVCSLHGWLILTKATLPAT